MTPIKEDTVLKIGDVIFSHSKYAQSFDELKHVYAIVSIMTRENEMYVIQDLENANKKYYFVLSNFFNSLNNAYFLL